MGILTKKSSLLFTKKLGIREEVKTIN